MIIKVSIFSELIKFSKTNNPAANLPYTKKKSLQFFVTHFLHNKEINFISS